MEHIEYIKVYDEDIGEIRVAKRLIVYIRREKDVLLYKLLGTDLELREHYQTEEAAQKHLDQLTQ